MKFKQLAIAGAIAVASSGSFAAVGDVVFTDNFGGTFDSAGTGTVNVIVGALAAGKYSFEAFVGGTGNISLSKGWFNTDHLLPVGPKFLAGSGDFAGGAMVVSFDWLSTSKPGGSYAGTVTITSAVPEPESYALMLAGLGVVGFIAMRRKAG